MYLEQPSRRIVAQPLPTAEPAERRPQPEPVRAADAPQTQRPEVVGSA
jgi:hypothetical protein